MQESLRLNEYMYTVHCRLIDRVTAIVLNQTYSSSAKQFSTYQQKIHSFCITRHFLVIETKLYACRCLKTNLLLFRKTVSYQRECLKAEVHMLYITRHCLGYIACELQSKLYACRCPKTNLLPFRDTVSYQPEMHFIGYININY